MAKTDGVARIIALAALGKNGGGSTELPIASADTLGGIKIGENLTIDENGVVSASGGEIKFYSIYLDTRLRQNGTIALHNISSPYNTELKEFISNVMTECANKNYNSILILIRFKCLNSIEEIPYLLLAFNSTYKISSDNNRYEVVSIGNEVLDNRIFYKYKIDINGTWSDNVFIVDTIVGNKVKREFISTETGLTKTNITPYTPKSDYNPATKKYVDDNKYSLPIASSDTLGGIKIGENLSIDENGVVSASGIKGLYTIGILNLGGGSPFDLTDEEKIQFNNIITDASSKNHSSVGIFAYADSGDMQPSTISNYMHCCLLYTVSSIKNTSTSFKFAGCYPTFGSIAQVKMLNITISGSWSNGVFTGTSYMCTWSDANLVTKTDVLVKKNTLSYTPTGDYNPATKKYVDDTITTAITTSLEGRY